MQREGAVPGSFVQNKMHDARIASLDKGTKHLELLVRAALKSVFELCSLIASRSVSAPPNCSPQPDDWRPGLFFCRCSYSTILRGSFQLVDPHAGPLVAFEKVDLDEVWRYLGMIQDGDGNCEHMAEQLRLQVGEAAEVLSRKKMSLALA
jgi:hypothetical protein